MTTSLVVNGTPVEVTRDDGRNVLDVLRDDLGLTGAKPGCGEGACGACTVLLDGVPIRPCHTPVGEVAGRAVTTVESLAADGRLSPVQQAFAEIGALQCGYCTPGMVLAVTALLATNPDPDDAAVRAALNGNVCRCGTYPRILRAVTRAARAGAAGGPAPSGTTPSSGSAFDTVLLLDAGLAAGDVRGPGGAGDETTPTPPWNLVDPAERDWFDRLGEGVIAIAEQTTGPFRGAGAWLHVAATGIATLFTGKVDLGQGTGQALALLVAAGLADPLGDELRAVRVVMGDTDVCPWDMGTFGSMSTPMVGAATRRAAAAAGRELGAGGVATLHGRRSVVIAEDDGADVGPIATAEAAARATAPLPIRVAAVTGARTFPTDVVRPGRLIGRVLRRPADLPRDSTLRAADVSIAETVPGVTVVRDGDLIGVVGEHREVVDRALAAIRADWDPPTTAPDVSRDAEPEASPDARSTAEPGSDPSDVESYLRAHPVHREGWGGAVTDVVGDPDATFARAPLRLAATYRTAFLAHVPMETRVAVAEWSGGRLTAWTGTQTPFGARQQVAAELGLAEAAVRIVVPPTGGGFGGKHTGDLVVEAARLARAAGRPVEVRWTRGEEFGGGHLRPAAVVDVRTACADGGVVGYELVDVNAGAAGFTFPYQVAHRRQVFQPADFPLAQGAYRALAATANTFARESHLDEVAAAMGIDPVRLRRNHLTDQRMLAVLDAAAERFGWPRPAPPATANGPARGAGIALGLEKGGRVATCAEVEVDDEGHLTVLRVVTAFECGAMVDVDGLVNQIEGATVMGLGGALFEQVLHTGGRLLSTSLGGYRVPRFKVVPAIDVVLVDRPDLPSAGGGETPIIALAPALANAVFAATGRRIRELPLAPDGVLRSAG